MVTIKSEANKVKDVWQIKVDVPFGVRAVSSYILDVNGNKVLIDAGLDTSTFKKKFFQEFRKTGLNIEDIDMCIITHNHIDHIGLLPTLKRKNPSIKIVMHSITKKILEWETDKSNMEEIEKTATNISYEMKNCGLSEEERLRIVQFFTYWPKLRLYQKPDIIVNNGDKILNNLEIIWTPGHSFGHICIFDKKRRILFSGDHILSRITPHIGNFIIPSFLTEEYNSYNFNNVLDQYLKSLDIIDNLAPKIIFPAHQDIIYNPHERIEAIKEHHRNRLSDISSAIKNNPLTPREISKVHFGEELDELNSFLALSEVLGHLLYLEENGSIKKEEKDGLFYYSS
jgi:glyoxylase-like metal-dependent hydrolase (beta-lactamase superfamily II)